MQDLNSVRLSSKGYYPAKKNFFMKTCNCLFIARSCNGLCRSAMSELLNSLRAFLISTVRSITPPTRSSSLLFSLSPSAAAVPPHCHPSWQVGIRLATDPFSGSCLKVSSTIINNRVYIVVQVVCKSYIAGGLYFFPAHHEINIPAEIHVFFADDHMSALTGRCGSRVVIFVIS